MQKEGNNMGATNEKKPTPKQQTNKSKQTTKQKPHTQKKKLSSWIKSAVGLVTWVVPVPSPIGINVFEWSALNFHLGFIILVSTGLIPS